MTKYCVSPPRPNHSNHEIDVGLFSANLFGIDKDNSRILYDMPKCKPRITQPRHIVTIFPSKNLPNAQLFASFSTTFRNFRRFSTIIWSQLFKKFQIWAREQPGNWTSPHCVINSLNCKIMGHLSQDSFSFTGQPKFQLLLPMNFVGRTATGMKR